ncbi:nuclease-related domain-containing protein [Paraburkholderia lycopersici]|uniref:Nuclease-related domain-containing protein n=1 Tax=Paraburkholderia lycopersici TaxID=416944 RepID=A0A1G6ZHP2_9BURK|nr:nuclease-related domain-containing protein [Paraburkholderia lycopersici]SDE01933.1 Nuclease-related domain-containing protein [Paraburkholderia lycopersici]
MKNPLRRPKSKQPLTSRAPARSEQEVLAELLKLCTKPGYVHAVAALCFRDNMLTYADRVTEADFQNRFDSSRLLRTEINTLIGLMLKAPRDWTIPSPAVLAEYVEASDQLLQELHDAMSGAFSLSKVLAGLKRGEQVNPFDSGDAMREPIFYAAESAYNFQYVDIAAQRYAADATWLEANVGFTIAQACAVAEAVDRLLVDRFPVFMMTLRELPRDRWSMLPAFYLTPAEVAAYASLEPELVERILLKFTVPEGNINPGFAALQDFNQITATPLLRSPSGEFICLQNYALAEAIYDSPFYWMQDDKAYRRNRDRHRGEFTENFVAERLSTVFGTNRVLTNIDVWQGKTKVAEIDVLVLWADRAIIVQAKAKRLTVEGRKGNDQVLRDDFKKSVQDAYDQGLTCAECIGDSRYRFTRADGSEINLPNITEIFMFCVVSDHYPALSFQTLQFLKTREVCRVRAALVTDVFLIDVVTELLPTPLQFLSFIARRARYAGRLLAAQELTILAYHLKHNLWLEDSTTMLQIAEDFTAGVDIAMMVRRRGLAGDATPEGFMTRFEGKTLGRIVRQIETRPEPAILEQGFQLLEMSGETFDNLSRIIDQQARRAAQDDKPHDVTMMFGDGSGFTVVCTAEPDDVAAPTLASYCTHRKYRQKADRWFGLCLMPQDAQLRFGLRLSDPWEQDDALEAATADMIEPMSAELVYQRAFRGGKMRTKVGRNDQCPCGSGRKYKKCCIDE